MNKDEKQQITERLKSIVLSMPDKPGSYQFYVPVKEKIEKNMHKGIHNDAMPKKLTENIQKHFFNYSY